VDIFDADVLVGVTWRKDGAVVVNESASINIPAVEVSPGIYEGRLVFNRLSSEKTGVYFCMSTVSITLNGVTTEVPLDSVSNLSVSFESELNRHCVPVHTGHTRTARTVSMSHLFLDRYQSSNYSTICRRE
jgi:hypothetical protein